ncbi:hypothetical protein BH11ACT2_BH11ACT2_10170 [soil metagenome]
MMTVMNVVAFIISFALFVVGIFLLGVAVGLPSNQGLVFFAGILVISLGIAVPIHILKRVDA